MKLAEALINRSDLQKRIESLEYRMSNNAIVQEGEEPAESPQELLKELDNCFCELERLITAINHRNALIKNEEGTTMTKLLAKRECLKHEYRILLDFLNNASRTGERARAKEIIIKSSMPIKNIRKLADDKAAELRKLEIEIQSLNWTNEIEV